MLCVSAPEGHHQVREYQITKKLCYLKTSGIHESHSPLSWNNTIQMYMQGLRVLFCMSNNKIQVQKRLIDSHHEKQI